MPLFTVAEARNFDKRQLANVTNYPDLTISGAEADIREEFERICCVAFQPTTETVVLDGRYGTLALPRGRVTAVTAVEERARGGATWAALGTIGTDYVYDAAAGLLTYEGGVYPTGSGNVRVTYTHGYATVPGAVKRAALIVLVDRLVASDISNRALYQTNDFGGVTGLAVAGRRGSYYGLPEVDAVLARYRECGPGVG